MLWSLGKSMLNLPSSEEVIPRLPVHDLVLTPVGLQLAEANPAIDAPSQMILGMKGFVKHTLSLGFTSERLALEQQVALDDWGEALPSVKLMQENARLIVLTKEVMKKHPAFQNPRTGPKFQECISCAFH